MPTFFRRAQTSPIVWGLFASAAFYGLVHGGPLDLPVIRRYFTHHPVEYAETVLFAIGLAALVLRMIDVVRQRWTLDRPVFSSAANASVDDPCRGLLRELDRLSGPRRDGYLARRLRAAVEHVGRSGSSEGLDDELKYLADLDATRMHNGYALFRVIIWAIPILGFLGTVIGITMALNALDPKALDESMLNVTTGLGVKFDTTALALAMSMLLMFLHFFVDRAESGLLEQIDQRAVEELEGRFPRVPKGPEGQLLAVRRMAETMVAACERLVQRQAELWQDAFETASARWNRMAESSGEQLGRAIAAALSESLKAHAQQMAASEQAAAEQNRRHWEKVTQAAGQNVQALATVQAGMNQQAEILTRALEASGEVTQLQDALNRNLATLAGAKNFDETILALSAAVHMLSARLNDAPAAASVQLESKRRNTKAA